MADNLQQHLESLRVRYNNGEVSALIGAGFSKNVHANYPNWSELLFDMVVEVFDYEISEALLSDKRPIPDEKKISTQVKRLINQHGYLDIVSKYIKKNGYRECIDLYIENHIPILNYNAKFINYNGKIFNICDRNLSAHKSLLNLHKLNTIYTTNYDNIFDEITSNPPFSLWEIISSSYHLSMSTLNKPIIKIHGDICKSKPDDFSFDGDHTKRYVITQEDYDTYNIKHEAFMQLMRISLLRETFILFGFSGDDPNFNAWIRWVRDVIIKNPKKITNPSNPDYFKIFLFSIDKEEPSEAKKQFFINHRIKFIPILSQEYQSVLGLRENLDDYQKIIIETMSYFGSSYDNLWQDVIKRNRRKGAILFNNNKSIPIDKAKLARIKDEKINNRLLSNTTSQIEIIEKALCQKSICSNLATLIILALRDSRIPIYLFDSHWLDALKKALIEEDDKNIFHIMEMYSAVLKNCNHNMQYPIKPSNLNFEQDYINILGLQFSFNFSKLRSYLSRWNPKGIRMQNKAALTCLYDIDEAYSLFKKCSENETNRQEKINISCLKHLHLWHRFSELPYQQWEKLGLKNLILIKNELINKLREQTSILSSGVIRFDITAHLSTILSMQILQLCIDSGALPSNYGQHFIHPNDWRIIAKELISIVPRPILWYTFFYSDDKLLTEIIYLIIDEESNKELVSEILSELIDAFFEEETPSYIKSTILIAISNLLKCSEVDMYEDDLIRIIHEYIYLVSNDNGDKVGNFAISKIAKFIKRRDQVIDIVKKCINFNIMDVDLKICILNEIAPYLTSDYASELVIHLDKCILNLSESKNFIILHILSNLLNKMQIIQIIEAIKNHLNKGFPIDNALIQPFAYFVITGEKNTKLTKRIKRTILEHPNLWANGFHGDFHTKPYPLPINNLAIKWTKNEISNMISIIHTRLMQILDFVKNEKHDTFILFSYKKYIFAINLFMENYSSTIKSLNSDILEKATQINEIIIEYRGYNKINLGLLSSNHTIAGYALKQFGQLIQLKWRSEYTKYIHTIVDGILYFRSNNLLSSLKIIAFITRYHFVKIKQKSLIEKLISILILCRINSNLFKNNSKYTIYECLVAIAKSLKTNDIISEDIDFWLNMKDRYVYNYGKNL